MLLPMQEDYGKHSHLARSDVRSRNSKKIERKGKRKKSLTNLKATQANPKTEGATRSAQITEGAVKATNALARNAQIVKIVKVNAYRDSPTKNAAAALRITFVSGVVSLGTVFTIVLTHLTRTRPSLILEAARQEPVTRIETRRGPGQEASHLV